MSLTKSQPDSFESFYGVSIAVGICVYMQESKTKQDKIEVAKTTVGVISKLKKSVGWTIDKFRLNKSLVINGTILKFVYREIDIQRRTFSNFWEFYCRYHQIIAV